MSSQPHSRPSTPSGVPVVRPLRHVLIGLGASAALTVLSWVTDLDLRWQALAYSPVEPH